jgi:hypothetical protein
MQIPYRIIALLGLVLNIGYGQIKPATVSQLEAFERFSRSPTARVAWSKEVGRINTRLTQAVVTVLVIEDSEQDPRQMRGIRIDFTAGNSKDQIYADEDLLTRVTKALDDVTNGMGTFFTQSRGCFGSCEFLEAFRGGAHVLQVSQCVGDGISGLTISTGKMSFHFPEKDPSAFAAAIVRAKEELKQR